MQAMTCFGVVVGIVVVGQGTLHLHSAIGHLLRGPRCRMVMEVVDVISRMTSSGRE